MTNQETNSFVKDNITEQENSSFTEDNNNNEVDKKSLEGQLAIVQKRIDDQLSFIETLKEENKQLREHSQNSAKIEDILSKLESNTSQRENVGQQNQQTITSPVNMDDLLREKGFVTKKDLEQEKLEALYTENFNKVSSAMIETYGKDKYLEIVNRKADELGMTVQDIDTLAKANPSAAIKLLEADKVNNTSASTTGSINTQAIDNNNNEQQSSQRPKSVMFGATTQDMLNSWRAAGEVVKKRMEDN